MKHSWNRKEVEKERKCVKNIVFIVNSIVITKKNLKTKI